MELKFEVENLKCRGCMRTIQDELMSINGVHNVDIFLENELITVDADESLRSLIEDKLSSLGYPLKGNNNILHKGKSYISCALGKIKE